MLTITSAAPSAAPSLSTSALVESMTASRRATRRDAHRILSELERDGWATCEDDQWRATQRTRDHFAALLWEMGEESPGGRPAYGYGRKIA